MVILLNCSFRGEKSNSNYFLGLLETQTESEAKRLSLRKLKDKKAFAKELEEAEALVLGMPLYVDGAPAQVVELMEELQAEAGRLDGLRVYVVSNMGFYESRQIHILFEIVKNWCEKLGMIYGGGLAIGAGEMMGGLKNVPLDAGPNQNLGKAMKELAQRIDQGLAGEDLYTEPSGLGRWMYKTMANMSWAPQARKNGVKRREIRKRR